VIASLTRSFAVFAFAVAAIVAPIEMDGVEAAERSIKVQGGTATSGYDTFVKNLSATILGDVGAATIGTGTGAAHYFDLNKRLGSQISGLRDLPSADKTLMAGALQTYGLFRALGGPVIDAFGVVATDGERYYLSLDGEGGRWVATPQEAISFLLQQFVQQQLVLIRPGDESIPCPYNYECLLKALYESDIPTIAYVSRDTILTIDMTGSGFANDGGPPVLIASEGVVIHDVTFGSSEAISARISIAPDAPLGFGALYVFNEGHGFVNVGRYGLKIVAGAEELQALISDSQTDTGETSVVDAGGTEAAPSNLIGGIPGITGTSEFIPLTDDFGDATAAAAVLGANLSGRIEATGDTDLFRIDIGQSGILAVHSEGPTDVAGAILDGVGTTITSDDDGGLRYNFQIVIPVVPGTYYLRVTHCCSGSGSYRLVKQIN
jgi:hypothetical protein